MMQGLQQMDSIFRIPSVAFSGTVVMMNCSVKHVYATHIFIVGLNNMRAQKLFLFSTFFEHLNGRRRGTVSSVHHRNDLLFWAFLRKNVLSRLVLEKMLPLDTHSVFFLQKRFVFTNCIHKSHTSVSAKSYISKFWSCIEWKSPSSSCICLSYE